MTKVNPLKETVPSSLALVLKSCMKVKYYLQHLRMLQNRHILQKFLQNFLLKSILPIQH